MVVDDFAEGGHVEYVQIEAPDEPAAPEHFKGCHPEDGEAPKNERPLSEIPDTEPCWHCGTPTTRGTCDCFECWDNADYVPPECVSHCPRCGRWWAYLTGINVTTITFNADNPQNGEGAG